MVLSSRNLKCDNKKKILYFGLDPSRYQTNDVIIHFPLILTKPFPFEVVEHFFEIPHTHVLFTSRPAVEYYFAYTKKKKKFLCVGEATAERLIDFNQQANWIADEPCGEGVIALLKRLTFGHILYPHSARARQLLPDYLKGNGTSFPLYHTFFNAVPLPNLDLFDKLIFTSPSTVEAFRRLCSYLPPKEKCEAIGPITQNALNKLFNSNTV